MSHEAKHRGSLAVDEGEEGGRAIAIEEGISAFVPVYASECNYLSSIRRLDLELLHTTKRMVAYLEVSALRSADWERRSSRAIRSGVSSTRCVAE
ncbi:hypothetical protein [Streptomyces sp. NBC_00620]|uniref:hypothetical protein n=1 Tax=Streptomyces sp. NBC_00620 TaxID=2903666 RepID=UPI00338DFCA9